MASNLERTKGSIGLNALVSNKRLPIRITVNGYIPSDDCSTFADEIRKVRSRF